MIGFATLGLLLALSQSPTLTPTATPTPTPTTPAQTVSATTAVTPAPENHDTVAIVGIVATLIGTVLGATVGAWVTFKVQDRQFKRDDRTRFHEERVKTYAEFNRACGAVMAAFALQDPTSLGIEQQAVVRAYETARLLASPPVWLVAGKVHAVVAAATLGHTAVAPALQQYNAEMVELQKAMRRELGVTTDI